MSFSYFQCIYAVLFLMCLSGPLKCFLFHYYSWHALFPSLLYLLSLHQKFLQSGYWIHLLLYSLFSLMLPGHHTAFWLVHFAFAALSFILYVVARVIFKNGNLVVTPRLNIFQWFLLCLVLKTKILTWTTRPCMSWHFLPYYPLFPLLYLSHWLPFNSSNKPYASCHRFFYVLFPLPGMY